MNASWFLPERVSRLLEPEEREAVLGDLMEAGDGPWRALGEIVGLVVRRQAGHWRSWRPWVAALGVSTPSSFLLMGASVMFCSGFLKLPGASQSVGADIGILAVQMVLLAGWSWTCGYFVGSLSRHTVWFSMAAYCAPCLFCLSRFRIESLSRLSLLLFVIPLALGVWRGLSGRRSGTLFSMVAAVAITALAVVTRLGAARGAGAAMGWIGSLILTWPSWSLAAASLLAAKQGAKPSRSKGGQHELG